MRAAASPLAGRFLSVLSVLSTGSPKRESAVNPIHEARLTLFLTGNLSQGPAWMLG
jgi:hypothetical protein